MRSRSSFTCCEAYKRRHTDVDQMPLGVADPNPKQQIRLIVTVVMMGGEHAYLTVLGYHLTARGWIMPSQDFEEINS